LTGAHTLPHRRRSARSLNPDPRRKHTRVFSFLALLAAALTTVVTFAQPGDRSVLATPDSDVHPNFDARLFKLDPRLAGDAALADFLSSIAPNADLAAGLAADRIAGVASLEARYKGIAIEQHAGLGTTELVSAAPGAGFLTPPSGDRAGALRRFLSANADAYGVSPSQVAELELVADYINPAGNMGWAEFEQRFNGIPVFQGSIRGGFTAKGELARTTGLLASVADASSLSTSPSVSAGQAVSIAAASVGWDVAERALTQKATEQDGRRVTFARGSMADDAKAWQIYFAVAPGVVRLAWATETWGDPDAFFTIVDAETGTVLFRKNMTEYQTQSATYNVYTSDSPGPSSPTPALPGSGYQAPTVLRTNATLIGNEAPNTFNNLGWITDGGNTTAGNNTIAGIDRDGVNGVDAPVTGAARVFSFAYNPDVDSPLTANYQNGDVTNMFYWVNRYHDATYLLGFTEAAFNFQNDNFGRGGAGSDRISSEGQDSSGTNNANFATAPDGSPGRMQMFIWTGMDPDRSGDLDQDVIYHELTHGLSNRLHANATGLSTNMARGMGEGWSDFYARSLLSTADENVNGIYTIGGWATKQIDGAAYLDNYYYGIRRFPYAPRSATGANGRPHSPLTFADIDATQDDLTDGAFPRGPIGVATVDQVHNIGEVWGGMLWEVRARFITRLGHAVGNQRFLQFVTDGMKLDPTGPTMLQARDAIIAAANAGGGTPADVADIWAGFATRGMGVLAQITNVGTGADNTRVVESFLTPSDPVPSFSINDVSLAEGNAGTTNFGFTVTLANPSATEHRVSFATASGTTSTATPTTVTVATPTLLPAGAPATTVGAASPYPLTLNLAGMTGTITKLGVRLNSLTHTFPGDLDFLLVGPGGQRAMFMSDVGDGGDVNAVNLTFEDGAPAPPAALVTGTYAPTDSAPGDAMSAPAPAGPYTSTLSVFNGISPNGTWSLYAVDDAGVDSGSLAGFSLLVTTTTSGGDYQVAAGQLIFPPGTTSLPVNVAVNGDLTGEPNETFFVNLSSPINAVVGDAQGVGTIVNDDAGGPLPPIAADDAFAAAFNTALVVAGPGVLANDNANGGGAMAATLVAGPSHGSLTLGADGGFTYTPVWPFVGADSFTYQASTASGPSTVATVSLSVAAPTTVQPPFNLRVDSVAGSRVTLRWDTLGVGPQASVFILEGGVAPGQVLASIPTGIAANIFTFVAPTGSFFIRMHGQLGADRSPASNEVPLHVNVPVAPSAPGGLLGLVNGSGLGLAWKNTFVGGAPSGLILDVSGSLATSIPLGLSDSFSFAGVPAGTYTLSLRATNAGGASPSSNPVTLTFPGACSGAPQAPANFLGYRVGNTVFVVWDPPTAGPSPSGYTLSVSGSFNGSFSTTGRAMSGVVGTGSYSLSVVATNACGSSVASPVQVVTVP
jgi:hypothetical protein